MNWRMDDERQNRMKFCQVFKGIVSREKVMQNPSQTIELQKDISRWGSFVFETPFFYQKQSFPRPSGGPKHLTLLLGVNIHKYAFTFFANTIKKKRNKCITLLLGCNTLKRKRSYLCITIKRRRTFYVTLLFRANTLKRSKAFLYNSMKRETAYSCNTIKGEPSFYKKIITIYVMLMAVINF